MDKEAEVAGVSRDTRDGSIVLLIPDSATRDISAFMEFPSVLREGAISRGVELISLRVEGDMLPQMAGQREAIGIGVFPQLFQP